MRVVEVVGEAEAAGLVADLADSGRTAAEVGRTAEKGVTAELATVLLAGDVDLSRDVIDGAEFGVAAIDDGFRIALTVAVAGEASLEAAGLAVVEREDKSLLVLAAEEWSAVLVAEVDAEVVVVDAAALRAARLLTAILDGGTSGIVSAMWKYGARGYKAVNRRGARIVTDCRVAGSHQWQHRVDRRALQLQRARLCWKDELE